jgi:putative ABC transport system permease protein
MIGNWFYMLKNYYTLALRFLAKSKVHTFINVFGLVVGFTCFILISLFVTDELTYDKSPNADRIYRVVHTAPENDPWLKGMPQMPVQMTSEIPEIENFSRLLFVKGLVRADQKIFEEDKLLFTDPSFFSLFPFDIVKGGYSFQHENSVLITQSTATRYFGSEDPIGKTIEFMLDRDTSRTAYTVSGVLNDLPSNIHFHFDFLLPYRENMVYQSNVGVYTYFLLKPGATSDAVESKFVTLNTKHHQAWGTDISQRITLQPIKSIHLESHYGEEIELNGKKQTVYILGFTAFLILTVGLINFINISLARSIKRGKEVGIRKVLGAQRKQVFTQFLLESLAMLVIAAIISLAVTQLMLPAFNAFTQKTMNPNFVEFLPLLAAAILFSGLLASAYPALLLSGVLPAIVLKDAYSLKFLQGAKLRSVLLVAQFSIAIALLMATLTIWQQLNYIQSKDLGFNKEQVIILHIDNPESQRNYSVITQQFRQHPGILQVAASGSVPGQDFPGWPYQLPATSSPTGEDMGIGTSTLFVDEAYLSLMNISIIIGRGFSTENSTADNQHSILVNESFLHEYGWDLENALDKRIQYFDPTVRTFADSRVIGVVRDFHFQSFRSKIEPLVIRLRNPENNSGGSSLAITSVSLKVTGNNLQGLINDLKQTWKNLDPVYPFDFEFLDAKIQKHYEADERFGKLFITFSMISIIITCLGLFGISLLTMEQRTKEIGIRKILGASTKNLIALLTSQFVKLLAVSVVVAAPLGYWAMHRWLSDFAYRINISVMVIISASIIVTLVAIVTVGVQALKAANDNPVDALRSE